MTPADLLPLVGVPVIVAGFVIGMNPLLVVIIGAGVTGLAAGLGPAELLELIGEKFLSSRQLAIFVLILPVVGILERHGLRERAQAWVGNIRLATAGRILMLYFAMRELTAALGLLSLAGHVQTVRPLLAPMAEGAAETRHGRLPAGLREVIRAHAAAADNIAAFFGEDIFIAFGAVLLMDAFLKDNGFSGIEPLDIGLWAIPTALAALAIHGTRLARLDGQIARRLSSQDPS